MGEKVVGQWGNGVWMLNCDGWFSPKLWLGKEVSRLITVTGGLVQSRGMRGLAWVAASHMVQSSGCLEAKAAIVYFGGLRPNWVMGLE